MTHVCDECLEEKSLCGNCHRCSLHCICEGTSTFDADELGLDPETDNTPGDHTRDA